jgi:hypothetical protein
VGVCFSIGTGDVFGVGVLVVFRSGDLGVFRLQFDAFLDRVDLRFRVGGDAVSRCTSR